MEVDTIEGARGVRDGRVERRCRVECDIVALVEGVGVVEREEVSAMTVVVERTGVLVCGASVMLLRPRRSWDGRDLRVWMSMPEIERRDSWDVEQWRVGVKKSSRIGDSVSVEWEGWENWEGPSSDEGVSSWADGMASGSSSFSSGMVGWPRSVSVGVDSWSAGSSGCVGAWLSGNARSGFEVGTDEGRPLKTADSEMLRKDRFDNRLSRDGRIRGDSNPLLSGLVGREESNPLSIRSNIDELL